MTWGKYFWSSNLTIVLLVICLAILHTPDNREFRVDTRHIGALRPAEGVKEHLPIGTRTIVTVDGKNYGIIETMDQAQDAIRHCVDGIE